MRGKDDIKQLEELVQEDYTSIKRLEEQKRGIDKIIDMYRDDIEKKQIRQLDIEEEMRLCQHDLKHIHTEAYECTKCGETIIDYS